MRWIALAAALLAAAPTEASACHHYSVWHYPWPQRCGVARQGQFRTISDKSVRHEAPFVALGRGPSGPAAIALPSLARADLDGGEADEAARARLLLRVALGAANAD